MRARPSLSTRKLALPKLRMARMRPLVLVSIRTASSSAFVFAPCAPTSCVDGVRALELVRIEVDAEGRQRLHVGAALSEQFVLLGHVDSELRIEN